jgi:hypothetical protein
MDIPLFSDSRARAASSYWFNAVGLYSMPLSYVTKRVVFGSLAKKDGAVIGGAMPNMDDDHLG